MNNLKHDSLPQAAVGEGYRRSRGDGGKTWESPSACPTQHLLYSSHHVAEQRASRARERDPTFPRASEKPERSEQKFWNLVRKERTGFKFRRQVPIGPFTVAFYCPEAHVAVEVDGEHHLDRADKDALRDALLSEYRVVVVRVPSLALFDEDHPTAPVWFDELSAALERASGRKAKWPL